MLRAFLLRHAECDGTGRILMGRTPGIPLNDAGRAAARRLADTLAHEPIDHVYTSPLERTVETAAVVAAPHDLKPVEHAAFLEIDYGDWTGRAIRELEPRADWREYNTHRATARIPGGEMATAVQARAVRGLLELRDRHPDGTIAIVSHADVIRCLVAHLLGMSADMMLRLEVDPASITEVRLYGSWPVVHSVNR